MPSIILASLAVGSVFGFGFGAGDALFNRTADALGPITTWAYESTTLWFSGICLSWFPVSPPLIEDGVKYNNSSESVLRHHVD